MVELQQCLALVRRAHTHLLKDGYQTYRRRSRLRSRPLNASASVSAAIPRAVTLQLAAIKREHDVAHDSSPEPQFRPCPRGRDGARPAAPSRRTRNADAQTQERRPILVVGDRGCAVTEGCASGARPEEEIVIFGRALECGVELTRRSSSRRISVPGTRGLLYSPAAPASAAARSRPPANRLAGRAGSRAAPAERCTPSHRPLDEEPRACPTGSGHRHRRRPRCLRGLVPLQGPGSAQSATFVGDHDDAASSGNLGRSVGRKTTDHNRLGRPCRGYRLETASNLVRSVSSANHDGDRYRHQVWRCFN